MTHELHAIIPIKNYSKRLHRKNQRLVWNKPMFFWALRACAESIAISKTWINTDSADLANLIRPECQRMGLDFQILRRSQAFVDPEVPKLDVVRDTINKIEDIEFVVPLDVAVLQCNSPELVGSDIDNAYQKFKRFSLKEIFTVNSDGIQNAALRIMSREHLMTMSGGSVYCGTHTTGDMIDIHTEEDLNVVNSRENPHDRVSSQKLSCDVHEGCVVRKQLATIHAHAVKPIVYFDDSEEDNEDESKK